MFILAKFVSDKVSLICEHTMQSFEYGTSLENFSSGAALGDAEKLRCLLMVLDACGDSSVMTVMCDDCDV